jgi:polysaccharide pyruvyl transferase WcaK-like protein
MRILLDQGIFDMRNAGQNALLQVAVARVHNLWPEASIEITTFAPYLLKLYHPNAIPVSPDGRHTWYKRRRRFDRIRKLIPPFFLRFMMEMREDLWHRFPSLASSSIKESIKLRVIPGKKILSSGNKNDSSKLNSEQHDYANLVSGFDLMVATGSQYLTDIAKDAGSGVLDRLEAAIQNGIPTAMVGQGIGPIEDPKLLGKAKAVLPKVDLIFVREKLEAPKLLKSFGVDLAKVFVTGDDAVELAYKARSSKWGSGLGISIRVMPYTQVDQNELSIIEKVLINSAEKFQTRLIGLPISGSIHERDDKCIKQLAFPTKNFSISNKKFPTPLDIIMNTQQCRLVVTGTFHAAVFALAQGIPAICLAKSPSYVNKLTGLADLFSPGCEVILLDDTHLEEKLYQAIDRGWQSAEELRPILLEAAARQVEWGHCAYENLSKLVKNTD